MQTSFVQSMQSDALDRGEEGRRLLNHECNRTLYSSVQPFAAAWEKVDAVVGHATETWVIVDGHLTFLGQPE